jgi:hypothetical protein
LWIGVEEADAVAPSATLGPGHRRHVVGLDDRRQERPARRRIVEGRVQVVAAQHPDEAERVGVLDHQTGVPAQPRQQVRGRELPPVHLASLERRRRGRRVRDGAPLDLLEVRDLGAGGARGRAVRPRQVALEARVGDPGAGNAHIGEEAERAAAHRLADRLRRVGPRQPLGMTKQTGGEVLASASNSIGKGRRRRNSTVRSSGASSASVKDSSVRPSGSRAPHRRIDATQSRARTGSTSWKRRPGRRRMVTRRPASSTAWPSAICGCGRTCSSRP